MDARREISPRQRTLLVFLSLGNAQELDPIRIMKGLFLFAMEAHSGWVARDARYEFVAYDYGPCSFQIYSDLDVLKLSGYVKARTIPGLSWGYYSLTAEGRVLAERAASLIHPSAVKYLETIRDFVTRLGFRELLAAIYARYPSYAVNSVFKFEKKAENV